MHTPNSASSMPASSKPVSYNKKKKKETVLNHSPAAGGLMGAAKTKKVKRGTGNSNPRKSAY